MVQEFNKKLIQIRTELYEDTQLTFQRLIELQKEMKEQFNTHYTKRIVIPKKYVTVWKYLLGAPFIYGMFVPSVIFHFSIEIYQQICFRLYVIPRVNYRHYFVTDRQLLSLLNPWEKINCIYCSYVNNLIRYSTEIGGRTERYWCPIKYYHRVDKEHSQYAKFIGGDNKNRTEMKKQWDELRDFSDLSSSGK